MASVFLRWPNGVVQEQPIETAGYHVSRGAVVIEDPSILEAKAAAQATAALAAELAEQAALAASDAKAAEKAAADALEAEAEAIAAAAAEAKAEAEAASEQPDLNEDGQTETAVVVTGLGKHSK